MIELAETVVVGGAGADESEAGTHLEQELTGVLVVILMIHLDAVQMVIADETLEHLTSQHRARIARPRMRDDGDALGAVDEVDGDFQLAGVALDIARLAFADPLRERVIAMGDDALLDHEVCDVGTADRLCVACEFVDLFDGDVQTVVAEFVDHLGEALDAARPDACELGDKIAVAYVAAVAEQVDGLAFELRGHLESAKDLEAGTPASHLCFCYASQRVVIRQGDDVQAGLDGLLHQHGGGVSAVGDVGVRVEVDSHAAILGSWRYAGGMKLAFQHSYPATPEQVVALLRNEEFIADVAQHAGAVDHEATITDDATKLEMEIAAPAKVQSVLGKTVKLGLTMRFGEARADGSVEGHVDVDVPGYPVDAWADAVLEPGGEGTVGKYDGEVKVKIPLIGKKVEGQVEPFMIQAFEGIERRARVWLTR